MGVWSMNVVHRTQTDRDTCDGIDDCDGRIDEDHQAERTVCAAWPLVD